MFHLLPLRSRGYSRRANAKCSVQNTEKSLSTSMAPMLHSVFSSDDFGCPHQHVWRNRLTILDFEFPDFRLFGHRITLSALAKTLEGIVNPICFAVFKLITNSSKHGR